MPLPSIIGPILPNGHNLSGIIYTLRSKYGINDPITNEIIIPYCNNNVTSIPNNIILWTGFWGSGFGSESLQVYLELKFPDRYIFPTGYSLKGSKLDYYYPTEWKVYGYNEEQRDKGEDLWTLLEHRTLTSDIPSCNQATDKKCNSESVGTFVFANQMPKFGYRYLRWIAVKSSESGPRLAASALDLYGALSKKSTFSFPKCSYTQNYYNYCIFHSFLLVLITLI